MEYTEILRLISGPLIGAVIGYFTNMIAVKMLFFPKREIRIFGLRLPFTPGVIPKGRPRLASSIGEVIEKHLLTKEDITGHLLSEQVEQKVTEAVLGKLSSNSRNMIQSLAGSDDVQYEQLKSRLCETLSIQIVKAIESSDASSTILEAFAEALKRKVSATPLMLLINDKTLGKILQPTKEVLDNMIDGHGTEYICLILLNKINEAEAKSGLELLNEIGLDETTVRNTVKSFYCRIVDDSVDNILRSVNISALVEKKINDMPIDDLERLVQEVMKKELNAIINLGALIGFILGLLNLFL